MSARGISRWTTAHSAVTALVAAAVVAARWLPQLSSSLWLDETGTVWLLQGSFGDSLGRALEYQGGSPLFYAVEWLVTAAFGTGELALRLPSLLAMIAATAFVYLLGRRLFSAWAGAIAAVIFVSLPLVRFAAGDARPYALATMTMVASALCLVRWTESARALDGAAYATAFVATVYLHYLYALPLAAHGLYLLARRSEMKVGQRHLLAVYGAIAAALAPSVPTLARVLSQRGVLSNPFPVTPAEVAGALFPASLAIVVVAGSVLAMAIWRPADRFDVNDASIVFLLSWIALPFVALVAVSTFGSETVLVPRYFSSVLPAVALFAGALVARIGAAWPQVVLAAAVAAVAVVRFPAARHTAEDWRRAAAIERALVDDDETPVVMFAGFVEARQLDWLDDPEKASYLTAPTTAYRFDGDVIAAPFGVNDESEAVMEELARDRLAGEEEFVLVTRGIDSLRGWLDDRLGPQGYTSTERGNVGGEILVYLFHR